MNNKDYLLKLLTAVFVMQWLVVCSGVALCAFGPNNSDAMVTERCPNVGKRVENIFTLSIATVLSLLTNV